MAGASPLGGRVTRRAGPGWFLVGDAVGFLDPFTGEGLHRALVSTELAAAAIRAALDRPARAGDAAAAYDRAMRRRFAAKDAVSWLVQAFLARPAPFEYAARRLATRPDVRATMGLVMGDLVPASRGLDPRFLAVAARAVTTRGAGKPHARGAAYAVVLAARRGRVLLCHIAPSVGVGDVWTLPGRRPGFRRAAGGRGPARARPRRPATSGELEGLIGVSDRVFRDVDGADRLHAIRILYRVRIVGGELRDEPDGSTDTCRWFKPSEARKLRLGELARHALDLVRADAAR